VPAARSPVGEEVRLEGGPQSGAPAAPPVPLVVFDGAAPYLAWAVRPRLPSDEGPWSDLEISRVDVLDLARPPEGFIGRASGDGELRVLLWQLRVGRDEWEAASREDRELIKAACASHKFLRQAVGAVLFRGASPAERSAARATLEQLARLAGSQGSTTRGLARLQHRTWTAAKLRPVVEEITRILRATRSSARRLDEGPGRAWLQREAATVNAALGGLGLQAVCSGVYIERLCLPADVARERRDEGAGEQCTPASLARQLVARAAGSSVDDLRRRAPLTRRKSAAE